jgi:hypothetical protein
MSTDDYDGYEPSPEDLDDMQIMLDMERDFLEGARQYRLRAYFIESPDAAVRSMQLLSEARLLAGQSSRAAVVLAFAAIELALKDMLLHPVVYAAVDEGKVVNILLKLLGGQGGLDRLKTLLSEPLQKLAGIDLRRHCRPGAQVAVWEDLVSVQAKRNAVLHRGEYLSPAEGHNAIAVAGYLVEVLVRDIAKKWGIDIGTDGVAR